MTTVNNNLPADAGVDPAMSYDANSNGRYLMYNYSCPFDDYGNYIFNAGMFILGQVSALEWREEHCSDWHM